MIVIKNMNKPERCLSCPFVDSNDECILQDDDKNFVADTWEKLYENCPIDVQEVCEWESECDVMNNTEFKVQCNHNPLKRGIVPNNFSYHNFKYCPFCGRKIVWK